MRTSKVFLSLLLVLALLVGLVPAVAETTLTDGTYTGTGKGMHSNIAVTVTVEDGAITSVTVDSQDETPGVSDPAFEQIPAAIVAAGNTDVDTVAGATLTSNGIIEAVNNALNGTTEETSTELTIEPDMIVVGSGMAGLVATARGVELGLNVLVLEQSVRTGGCIHYAGGTVSGAGFKIQKENGVEDTPEAFYADIEALGGDVEVKTELGVGTTFTVRLPLTLAIIQALMVEIRDEKYAIALGSISNIEDIPVKDIKYVEAQEVIHLRGKVIPLIRMDQVLDIEPKEEEPESLTVVIVQKGENLAGLVVDNLIGQQEIVIKSLGKYINNNKIISGATILGDGEVALILDVNVLM